MQACWDVNHAVTKITEILSEQNYLLINQDQTNLKNCHMIKFTIFLVQQF